MDRIAIVFAVAAISVTLVVAAPSRIRVSRDTGAALRLGLPSNATSIRDGELSERFSCMGRHYGYYADPDNDCQLFHVCLPVQFDDGRSATYKWSFVCPEETIFNQESFTCTRREDAIACEDSERFYDLNEGLGKQQSQTAVDSDTMETEAVQDQHVDHQPVSSMGAMGHPVDHPFEQRPMERPVDRLTGYMDRPMDHPVERPMERPMDRLTGYMDRPMGLVLEPSEQMGQTTETGDETTFKYGAFTTIRY